MGKHILVTGGSGFIGHHLVPVLLQKNYRVTVVDKHPTKHTGVAYHNVDFTDNASMKKILSNVDAVFHLAAMVGVDDCRLHPNEVMRINYEEARRFIDLCIECKVKHFFFTSSSEVYGNSHAIPYKEDSVPQPISMYGKAKALTEACLKSVHKKSGLAVSIVRLFNVYGPLQRPNFVVPIFVNLAKRGKRLTIIGDGSQIRCFTYVGDAVIGMIGLFEYNTQGYEIVNIGNKNEYTIAQLAQTVLELIPTAPSTIEYLSYGKNGVREKGLEIDRRVPSVVKAANLLGFEAVTSLRNGIKSMLTST